MQPGKTSVVQLFSAPTQYAIPVFQRGYVWTLEKQVVPLWMDIEDRAMKVLERNEQAKQVGAQVLKAPQKHFLGSIVLSPVGNAFGRVPTYEVIDGQQRTTTLHLLLLAFRHAARQLVDSPVPGMLDNLVRNPGPYNVVSDYHKVWPTQAGQDDITLLDGAQDCQAVCLQYPARQGNRRLERPLMVESYLYLYHACLIFMRGVQLADVLNEKTEQTYSDAIVHAIRNDNEIVGASPELPLLPTYTEALYMALQELVQIMTLTLEAEDDAQIIFESLNARGEPLLASDLIRNFVFLEASRKGLNVNGLYFRHWKSFDEQPDQGKGVTANRYWREKERQGRLTYPRIDLFFHHYTVMRRQQESVFSHVFEEFKEWWQNEHRDIDAELARVVRASNHFRDLISPEGDDYLAEFARLVKALDVSTLTPLYLSLREKIDSSSPKLRQALGDLASYITRRAVCGYTSKGYNKLFVRLLGEVAGAEDPAGALRAHLLKLGGHSQVWPSNAEFIEAWMEREVYKELRPAKVCAVLRALEYASRTPRQENFKVPPQVELTVEHVLPQSWQTSMYYVIPGMDESKRLARMRAVQTFGNLTLLTQPLNSAVSNGPFLDQEYEGKSIKGKRSSFRDSLLILNAYFQQSNIQQWADAEIRARGQHLLQQALVLWSKP